MKLLIIFICMIHNMAMMLINRQNTKISRYQYLAYMKSVQTFCSLALVGTNKDISYTTSVRVTFNILSRCFRVVKKKFAQIREMSAEGSLRLITGQQLHHSTWLPLIWSCAELLQKTVLLLEELNSYHTNVATSLLRLVGPCKDRHCLGIRWNQRPFLASGRQTLGCNRKLT